VKKDPDRKAEVIVRMTAARRCGNSRRSPC
jgi:hypothetical protein